MKNKRQRKLVFRSYPQNQLELVRLFLEEYQAKYGFWPSKREVAVRFGTHHSTVGFWYRLMEEAGMLKRHPGIPRAIELL